MRLPFDEPRQPMPFTGVSLASIRGRQGLPPFFVNTSNAAQILESHPLSPPVVPASLSSVTTVQTFFGIPLISPIRKRTTATLATRGSRIHV